MTLQPALTPFHVAIVVHDLNEARKFYGGVLGCPEGRSSDMWVDFNLYGHQFVCHTGPESRAKMSGLSVRNLVDGDNVPVPHYGVVLAWEEWEKLVARLTDARVNFLLAPRIRFAGKPGEQGTFFVADPTGNVLEFKGFRDLGQLFAT